MQWGVYLFYQHYNNDNNYLYFSLMLDVIYNLLLNRLYKYGVLKMKQKYHYYDDEHF